MANLIFLGIYQFLSFSKVPEPSNHASTSDIALQLAQIHQDTQATSL